MKTFVLTYFYVTEGTGIAYDDFKCKDKKIHLRLKYIVCISELMTFTTSYLHQNTPPHKAARVELSNGDCYFIRESVYNDLISVFV